MSKNQKVNKKDDLEEWASDEENNNQQLVKKTKVQQEEINSSGYAGGHSTGFKDFMLKAELYRAIQEAGFEHPSEVQQEAIPKALNGGDILCQAKSGMGKTAVFVTAIIQRLDDEPKPIQALVLCHVRELAFQIYKEFNRLSKYLKGIKTQLLLGGENIQDQRSKLEENKPTIIVGTPGRVLDLVKRKYLKLNGLKFFILDECDKMLEELDMRTDVQMIFKETPCEKQVMMFSATMSQSMKQVCSKFMQKQSEIFIDDDTKLTLHGLTQYYLQLSENEKISRLLELIDQIQFNQVMIFVKQQQRAEFLCKYLIEQQIPAITVHGGMQQHERLAKFSEFCQCKSRVMVVTDLFGRGIDVAKVNVVFNFDMPSDSDTYLHRVGRAGRFGTKGLAITFVTDDNDQTVLQSIQNRFSVNIQELKDNVDISTDQYINK